MNRILIKNARIVNEGTIFEGDVLIENDLIVEIAETISPKSSECKMPMMSPVAMAMPLLSAS